MTATAQNHTLYEGEERVLRFTLVELDADGYEIGPLDLTGATITYALGTSVPQTIPGVIDGAPAAGVVTVSLVTLNTAGAGGAPGDHRDYIHELWVTDSSANDLLAAVGRLTVRGALLVVT